MKVLVYIPIIFIVFLSSCGAYLNQPVKVKEAQITSKTNLEKTLTELPKPPEPIVVAVYKFKDQTGQYKPSEVGSSFSTAVTQGGTNILIKALDDSGWFKVIERENIGNLLNERKIIRQTRMQYQSNDESKVLVNPLLFAGVILEGGVVSYDANVVTGGIGVRYFGSGGSTAYRQDRVTVYLRAIATKTGEVLKNVTTSKTVLSQSLDGGVFRYVKFSRLLEAETGFTFNEPSDIAVTEAVQKAVYSLVVEGIKEGLWNIDTSYSEAGINLMSDYEKEVSENDLEDYLGVKRLRTMKKWGASASLNNYFYQGDYPFSQVNTNFGLGLHYELNKILGFDLSYNNGQLQAQDRLDLDFFSIDLKSRVKFLGGNRRSPYLTVGAGNIFYNGADNSRFTILGGLGIDVYVNPSIAVNVYGQWHQLLADDIDGLGGGRYVDYYYQFGGGVKYQFGSKNKMK